MAINGPTNDMEKVNFDLLCDVFISWGLVAISHCCNQLTTWLNLASYKMFSFFILC
jgi:hypothetical protein